MPTKKTMVLVFGIFFSLFLLLIDSCGYYQAKGVISKSSGFLRLQHQPTLTPNVHFAGPNETAVYQNQIISNHSFIDVSNKTKGQIIDLKTAQVNNTIYNVLITDFDNGKHVYMLLISNGNYSDPVELGNSSDTKQDIRNTKIVASNMAIVVQWQSVDPKTNTTNVYTSGSRDGRNFLTYKQNIFNASSRSDVTFDGTVIWSDLCPKIPPPGNTKSNQSNSTIAIHPEPHDRCIFAHYHW